MTKMVLVRKAANEEKRAMSNQGTQYRRDTAVYTSRLVNDLLSSGVSKPLTRAQLVHIAKAKYQLDNDRAQDVAKNVAVQFSRVRDKDRLADYYQEAERRLKNRDKNRLMRNK